MPSNLDAVKAMNHRQALVSLLETLAEQLDTTEAAIHAQLAGQYRQTWDRLVELDEGAQPQEVTPLDEIRRRRAARDGAAADHSRAAGDR